MGTEENPELVYAKPLFVRLHGSERFLFADRDNNCAVGNLTTTSFVIIRGPNGEQINIRGDANYVKVKDGDIITLHANTDGGKYLSLAEKTSKFKPQTVSWSGNFEDVRLGDAEFQFIVHLAASTETRRRVLSFNPGE